MRVLLPLLCMIPLTAACDRSSGGGPSTTQSSLTPGDGVDCGQVLADCLAAGVDEVVCKEKYTTCEGANAANDAVDTAVDADPWAQCKLDFQSCLDQGYSADLCLEKIRWCAGLCVAPTPAPTDPGTAGGDRCMPVYDECVKAGVDPVACKEKYTACWDAGAIDADGDGIPDGGDPGATGSGDPCMPVYDECVKAGADPVACKEKYTACWSANNSGQDGDGDGRTDDVVPPPDPNACQSGLDACLAAGKDPVVCKQSFEACLGLGAPDGDGDGVPDAGDAGAAGAGDPGAACESGYQACLGKAVTDVEAQGCLAALEACKAAIAGAK